MGLRHTGACDSRRIIPEERRFRTRSLRNRAVTAARPGIQTEYHLRQPEGYGADGGSLPARAGGISLRSGGRSATLQASVQIYLDRAGLRLETRLRGRLEHDDEIGTTVAVHVRRLEVVVRLRIERDAADVSPAETALAV